MNSYNIKSTNNNKDLDLKFSLIDELQIHDNRIEYNTNSPIYMMTSLIPFSVVSDNSDFDLAANSFYELNFINIDLDVSFIFYIFFYDEKSRIDTFEIVIDRSSEKFIFKTPLNYSKSRIAFRVINRGYFSVDKIFVNEIKLKDSIFNKLYQNTIESNNKKLRKYYNTLLKSISDYNILNKNILIEFVKSYIEEEAEENIFKLLEDLKKQNLYEAIVSDKNISDKINNIEIRNLNMILGEVRISLHNKGIKKYIVYMLQSGLGDILTNLNMSAYICELFGLQFAGVTNTEVKTRSYYQDLFKKIGIFNNDEGEVYYLEVNNIIEDYKKIIKNLNNLDPSQYDTICLIPKNPSSLSSLRVLDDFNKNLFNNQFDKYFHDLLIKSKLFETIYDTKKNITIHLRLGDVASIRIGEYVVIPYEINRKNYEHAVYNLETNEGSKEVYSRYKELVEIKTFLESVKKISKNFKVNLVTDGFDLTKTRIDNDLFKNNLTEIGIPYNKEDIFNYLEYQKNELDSIKFDNKSIGEDGGSDSFIKTVKLVLSSDILISNSRSFIYNILTSFKTNLNFQQKFYSPLVGNYFDAVKQKNVILEKYSSLENVLFDIIDENNKTILNKLVNYSPYGYYYTSSNSDWEECKVGSLLDKCNEPSRFSFHTQEEDNPFVVVYFKEQITVEAIEIIFRDKYSEKILPICIEISNDGSQWNEIVIINTIKPPYKYTIVECAKYGKIQYIKIKKNDFGSLFLSAVNIYILRDQFLNIQRYKEMSNEKTIIVFTPFYGLGGRLETLASAFGLLQNSNFKNIGIDWGDNKAAKQIKYPYQIDYDKDSRTIKRTLSNNISSFILNENKNLRAETNISHHRAPTTIDYNKETIFVSRDSLGEYINKGEHLYSTMQRLYSNIIPSDDVLEYLTKIEKKYNLEKKYNNAIGIHVRHGNGERYCSDVTKTWGVKPPSAKDIVMPVKKLLESIDTIIDTLIVCSDCISVKDLLEKEFKNKLDIIFISDYIQPIGAGCNHLEYTFSKKVKRNKIDKSLDELITFSEILCLSKCVGLVGGKSFFFNSIVGFSHCNIENIQRINNQDRYIILDDDLIPIEEVNSGLSNDTVNILINNEIKTDGIFFKKEENKVYLSYFDIKLFYGEFQKIKKSLKEIKKVLFLNRLY